MLEKRFGGSTVKSDRKESEGNEQNDAVNKNLFPNIGGAAERMRVDIAREQHDLEKQHTRRPDRGGPAQEGEDHLADHRLADKKQESAGEQRYRKNGHS